MLLAKKELIEQQPMLSGRLASERGKNSEAAGKQKSGGF
jgi:hypothetical protein